MITSLYAALLALLFIALSVHVIRGRRQFKIGIGSGGHDEIQRRIRAQANFAEYTPIFLIMLALAEYNGLPSYGAHLLGAGFTMGRLAHAYGMVVNEVYKDGNVQSGTRYRVRGMQATFSLIGTGAVILIIQYIMRLI